MKAQAQRKVYHSGLGRVIYPGEIVDLDRRAIDGRTFIAVEAPADPLTPLNGDKAVSEAKSIVAEAQKKVGHRVVIMAAGGGKRWNNYTGVPKQMADIGGEPLMVRTIRMLRSLGVSDIWVTVKTIGQYGPLNAKEFVTDPNEVEIDRVWGARTLSPCIFLYGDVYYTPASLESILSSDREVMFWGRRVKGAYKNNKEIFAIKSNDWLIQKAGELREMNIRKEVHSSLGQHLLCHCLGFKVDPRSKMFIFKPQGWDGLFADIEDGTDDIDKPIDYIKLMKTLSTQSLSEGRRYSVVREYYTIERLNQAVKDMLTKLPTDIDLVIGIPRDGMLVATLISIYRNVPLTDIDSFIADRTYSAGMKHRAKFNRPIKAALMVDDICATGSAMREAKARVSRARGDIKIYTAAVYISKGVDTKGLVDFYGEALTRPCHYEWTDADSVQLPGTMFDLDGVICENCPHEDDDDGPRYAKFLTDGRLKLRPERIGFIVTWREEKYRAETEAWLAKHGITYNKLIMAHRSEWRNPADYKAHHYKSANARLFIESSDAQAERIALISGKPVLAYGSNKFFGGKHAHIAAR